VPPKERFEVRPLGMGVYYLTVRYGFMDDTDIPSALQVATEHGLEVALDEVTYFLGRETLIATRTPGMALWRERLFVMMARNAVRPTGYFQLPPERVIELGVQVEL
jgi:KUP system potassium uptake protein